VDDRAAAAAAQTFDLLRRLRPGQSLDDEIAAYEADHLAEPDPHGDVVSQPTWNTVTPAGPTEPATVAPTIPATPGTPAPPAEPVAANAEPQWPTEPEWPSQGPAVGLPFLGRPATPTGGIEALWAESAREVATAGPAARAAGGVQPCVSCGLSLSATARFCRRCGTRQG